MIVLASQKHPYDEAKGKAAGVDDHVIKPFDTQHVIDKVKRVLASAARAAAGRPRGSPLRRARPPRAPQPQQPRAAEHDGTIAFERRRAQPNLRRSRRVRPRGAAAAPAAAAPAPAAGGGSRDRRAAATSRASSMGSV